MRHLLRDDDLLPIEQDEILAIAARLKFKRFAYNPLQGPETVAVIFDKPSTRTRVSFAVGIAELGGIPLILDSATTQAGRGEPVADTARVLGRMVSAIVWRTFAQADLETMAEYAGVPVINALSDDFHPCQLLADWLTIREHHRRLSGLTVAYVGDGACNMANSYVLGGAVAGMHIRIGSPADFQPDQAIVERAREIGRGTGATVTVTDDPEAAVTGADAVITDTWVSMGQEDTKAERLATFAPYAVTQRLLDLADPKAPVLHCLPAYRGLEIEADVIDGPRSLVWEQAENRLHVQKAALLWLLERSGRGR